MPVILGTGAYRYEVVEGWAKLPPGQEFNADVAAVGIDRQDRVYAFNRGAHPMVVLDREGHFLRSWGEGVFKRAHGVHMGPDDTIYLTDDGDHTVRKCTLDGKILLEIGIPGRPAPFMSLKPFNRCTHTALSPDNHIYVSDGYGNACVHKYSPDGKRLFSWGEPGTDPGQFNLPHNIGCDADGWVYVADRENHRVQVFDGNGKYETQWNNLHRPCALCRCGDGKQPNFIIGELGPGMPVNRKVPNLGPRLSIVDAQGKRIARLGGENGPGLEAGKFLAPHGKYETQWNNLHRPCALCCCGGGKQPRFIIGELGPGMPVNRKVRNLGPRLTIVDAQGKRIARLGGENGPGLESGKFLAPHGIALDSRGDIYLGEVGVTDWKTSFPDTPMPAEVAATRCVQKLERV